MSAGEAAATLEKIVWGVAAAGLGWLASVMRYQNTTAELRREIAELKRRQAIEMQLLAAIAEKTGVQSQYIAAVQRMAAPTDEG